MKVNLSSKYEDWNRLSLCYLTFSQMINFRLFQIEIVNLIKMEKKKFKRVDNTVEKGEIVSKISFLQCSQKTCTADK